MALGVYLIILNTNLIKEHLLEIVCHIVSNEQKTRRNNILHAKWNGHWLCLKIPNYLILLNKKLWEKKRGKNNIIKNQITQGPIHYLQLKILNPSLTKLPNFCTCWSGTNSPIIPVLILLRNLKVVVLQVFTCFTRKLSWLRSEWGVVFTTFEIRQSHGSMFTIKTTLSCFKCSFI